MTQVMIQPSSWLPAGIRVGDANGRTVFQFADALQARLEELLARRRLEPLSDEEVAELAGLAELDRIFTFINAELAAR